MSISLFYNYDVKSLMPLKTPSRSILVPSISVISGFIVYLILSGAVIQGFNPFKDVVEASSYGSFSYVTNIIHYETTEVSFNMEDMYNSTYLYDFSLNEHFSRKEGSLEFETGIYGKSLRWPSGQIIVADLDIIDMSFTIETWIYPTSEDFISLAGTEAIYPFIQKASNESMLFQYSGGTAALYSNKTVGLNAWTHVALVYDVVSGVAKWYLNASEQGSKEVGPRVWDGKWSIGRMWLGNEWKGKIDEFRIYKGDARTQSEVEEDMKTSIAYKLIVTGLNPYSDVAQLWYPDGEFARLHMLQQDADAEGKVEFNVYLFSGHRTSYTGILKVIHSGITYTSPILSLSWGDVYYFSLRKPFSEVQIAVLVAGLIIIVPSTIMVIRRYISKRRKRS